MDVLDGVCVIDFFGDGVGGKTLGSFAMNDFIGVLGLVVFVRFFVGIGLTIVCDGRSSGNCSRFNLRRTSYN